MVKKLVSKSLPFYLIFSVLALILFLSFVSADDNLNSFKIKEKKSVNKFDPLFISFLQNESKKSENLFLSNSFSKSPSKKPRFELKNNKIPIIISLYNKDNFNEMYFNLVQKGVDIKFSYKLIDAISADVSYDMLESLALDENIKKIYLDKRIEIPDQNIESEKKIYELNRKMKSKKDISEISPLLYESIKLIDAPFMWDYGIDGSAIKIAILDTGIDDTHPDLTGKVIAKRDFTLFDGELKTEDGHGHGTHVAGTAAGTGKASYNEVDTFSRDVSHLKNLPLQPNNYNIGEGIFQFYWDEGFLKEKFNGQVDLNNGFDYEFNIDKDIAEFTVSIQWSNNTNDIDMKLYDPSGKYYSGSYGYSNSESINVKIPKKGTWRLVVYPYYVTEKVNVNGTLYTLDFNNYSVLVINSIPIQGNVTLSGDYPDNVFDFETLSYNPAYGDIEFSNYSSLMLYTYEGGIKDMGMNQMNSITCSNNKSNYSYEEVVYLGHTYCVFTDKGNIVKIYITNNRSDILSFLYKFQTSTQPIVFLDLDGDFNTKTDQLIASKDTHFSRTEKTCSNDSWGFYCYYEYSYHLLYDLKNNLNSLKIGYDLNWDNKPDVLKGVAPGSKLLNGKVLSDYGVGYDSGIIAGIEWAVFNNADIISMSLGGWENICDGNDPLSEAVKKASEMGVVVVVAAGNSGWWGRETVSSPGCADKIITVGSSSKYSPSVSWFSSQGPTADGRIKPEILAPGEYILAPQAIHTQMGYSPITNYVSSSGTSMATPHIAGAVALLKQINKELNSQEIKEILMNSATDVVGESVFRGGAGIINLSKAYILLNSEGLTTPSMLNLVLKNNNTKIISLDNSMNNPTLSAIKDEFRKILEEKFLGKVNKTSGFTYNFTIDEKTTLFTVIINWSNSLEDIDMVLRNPLGIISGWSGRWNTNYESITINRPKKGTWTLEVYPWYVTKDVNVNGSLYLENLVEWNWFKYNNEKKELIISPNEKESGLYSGKIFLNSNNNSLMIPASITLSNSLEFFEAITHSYISNPCNEENRSIIKTISNTSDPTKLYASFDGYFCQGLERKAYSFNIPKDSPYFDIFVNWWTPSSSTYGDIRLMVYDSNNNLYSSSDDYGEFESMRIENPIPGEWTIVIESDYLLVEGIIFSGEIIVPIITLEPDPMQLTLRQGESQKKDISITNLLDYDLDFSIEKIIWNESPLTVTTDSNEDNNIGPFSYSYKYYNFNVPFEYINGSRYLKSLISLKNNSISYGIGAYIFDSDGHFINYVYNYYGSELLSYHRIPESAAPGNWTMVVFIEGFNSEKYPFNVKIWTLNKEEWNWVEIVEPAKFFKGTKNITLNIKVPYNTSIGDKMTSLYFSGGWWSGNIGSREFYKPLFLSYPISLDIVEAECKDDADCSDDLFCNGEETCIEGVCQSGNIVDCNDNILCTEDICNEINDKCINIPDNSKCSENFYCYKFKGCRIKIEDKKKPQFYTSLPKKNSFAKGDFEISFKEDNPLSLILFYEKEETEVNLETCKEEKGKTYCKVNINLSKYDGASIIYYFELTDIAGNKVISKRTSVKVDTTKPLINNLNDFWESDGKKIYFDISIIERNFDEAVLGYNYHGNKEKKLCSKLKYGKCKAKFKIRNEYRNLKLIIRDEAGNEVINEVNLA